jgi:RNA polymerase primary sigma factor
MSNEELVKQIQQGINQTDNMEQLYSQNYGYIFKIAKKYAHVCDIEDLMQEAYFGLYEAVQRYEDIAGVLFMSYAGYWIKQAIKRYLENNGLTVRIPSHLYNKVMRYKKLISTFEMQLGRKPLDNELRACLEVGQQALEGIKKAYHDFYNMKSLDEVIPSTDDELKLGEAILDPDIDIENNVIDGMMENRIQRELWQIVKDNTTDKENEVIICRFEKDMSLAKTGEEFGITREGIRKIEAKALRKLRHPSVRRKLEERFEVNYAKAYRGSVSSFKNTGTSITEYIALCNLELQGIN